MDENKISSLALSFASFLIDRIKVKSIILFGSAVTGSFDDESDIDLFIETEKKNEDKIKPISGIQNEISIKCGNLDEWKDLKRSIISNGVVLYGKYQGKPSQLKHRLLFVLTTKRISRAEKIKIWRKVYGYSQKVGKKVYVLKGIAERKIGMGAFIVSMENSKEIIDYLNKYKTNYTYFDIWVE